MASSSFYYARLDVDEPQSISFAPNMTEASFTSQEEPEFLETALLFPPADSDATDADSTTSFKRTNTTRKKDTHIPRPPNAFILFRSSFVKQQHIPGSIEGNHSQLSKIVGACWQRLSYEERQVWERKAKEARAEHKRLYPNYRFVRSRNPTPKPVSCKEKPPAKFVNTMPVVGSSSSDGKTTVTTTHSPTKIRRRNHRMEEDPRRCEQIAKLLVAGHKGSSLEAMVKQLDARTALRHKQGAPISFTPPIPEHAVVRGSVYRVTRRSSSCPPLDIAAAEVFRLDGPKSTSGPDRRPKPLRAAATLPYPPTFKTSRSVSPPISPSYLDTASTPIEGPFANSTFNFFTALPNAIPRPASIAPKDTGVYDQLSSPSGLESYYPWPLPTLSADNSFYSTVEQSSQSSVASAPVPLLPAGPLNGRTGWNSEYDYPECDHPDETGTSTAPPSTPEAPSPVVGLSVGLPLEEVAVHASLSHDVGRNNESLDLSEYAKGLQLFSPQNTTFTPGAFSIPQLHELPTLTAPFDQQQPDPAALWQLQNIMEGMVPGIDVNGDVEDYRY